MKVIHWNHSKKTSHFFGVRKYEDELYRNLSKTIGLVVERIKRRDGRLDGNIVVSWLLTYKCKDSDIVHATFQTIAPAVYFNRPKRFVVTVHDLIPLVYPRTIRDISARIQWVLTPRALRSEKLDRIIAISEFTKKEIIRLLGIEEDKISVVHQGVDHDRYKPMDKLECKKKFGLNPRDKHILVVASNEEHKRMDLAKKIFELIRAERDDVKLIKAGYGQSLNGEGIINVGWVAEEDMPALFNAGDVYLHTSEYEGFGLPVLESMACGTPVVVNKEAKAVHEFAEECAHFIDEDVNKASEKILSLLDKEIEIDERAVKQSKRFSWKKTAEETAKIYEEVM